MPAQSAKSQTESQNPVAQGARFPHGARRERRSYHLGDSEARLAVAWHAFAEAAPPGSARKAIQSGNLTRAGILAAKQNLGTVDLRGIAPNVSYAPQPGPPTRTSLIKRSPPCPAS